jgi:transposase
MTLHPQPIPPVPAATAAAVLAAFPKGNIYVDLRAEFGILFDDSLFLELYPPGGRKVEVAPWRLALVLVMQHMEGLRDRQAADAVRRCLDWKYALSLELTDPGFDFTLLHDFRERLVKDTAAQRLLDTLLDACKARGLIKTRGTMRTDSTHVLAAVRTLHHLECVLETMHLALNRLTAQDAEWVRQRVPVDWFERYGLRAEQARFPKETSKREALAQLLGADGYQLLEWVMAPETPECLRDLPAIETLRQVWIQQFYRCTIPGHETLRLRSLDEKPPTALLIQSPYDIEARYSSKRDTHWVGYKTHFSETCDANYPDLITQVITTPATTPDSEMGPAIQQDLADRDLLPGTHLLDSGYVDSHLLVTAHQDHQIDVLGPPLGSYSRQHLSGQGYDLQAFVIDWEAETAYCPQGRPSVKWTPGHDGAGHPVIRIRFDKPTCRACPVRPACTWAKDAPRQLTVRPQEQHVALQAARERQDTAEFQATYALRAGVESSISQGTRRFEMRHSRYLGQARTHLQELLVAVAMNLVRIAAWLWDEPLGECRRPPGHFARLAPQPLSRQTVLC